MGVLLMFMTIGGLLVAGVMLGISLFTGKKWLTRFTVSGVMVWFAFYAVMLIGFSVASKEKTLSLNEARAFCGFYLDCHMHAVVTGVRTADKIGDMTAAGTFYIVNVRVFSDARNANIAFRLLEPRAEAIGENGKAYPRDTDAENRLPTGGVSLAQDIKGRETIEKEIVFDLPTEVSDPRLDIAEGYGIDHAMEAVLVDDEDSILHKRSYFDIREQKQVSSVQ
jgi:hypothetical protein